MSIKTAVGEVSGTRQNPSLYVTAFEDTGGTLSYDDALSAAIAAAPTSILNAQINTTDIVVMGRSRDSVAFEINYGRKSVLTLTRSIQAATRPQPRFNFFSPSAVYDSGGDATSLYAGFKTKLNHAGSMFEFNAGKPVIVDPLSESRTLSYNTSLAFVTDSYLTTVEEMVNNGVFNNATFLGNAAGQLQLVSFTASEQTDGSWSLGYGMGFRENRTSVSVADGIVLPTLRGCDSYWPIYEEKFADGKVQPFIKAVVVGQQWEMDDFTALNLPWQGYLSTRTDNTSGVITTLYAHDITALDNVTIYWEGGYRLNSNVSGVTTTTVTFDTGSGDILPALGTRVLAVRS